jgi:hypothetical protein
MSSLAVFLILGGATAFAAVSKVGANEIKANSIKTGKIVKEAVTAGKLKNGAVAEGKIADGAVTTNKIADNAVSTNKIANNAVSTGKLADNAVTNGKIANGAVTGNKIGASTVTRSNISESELIPRGFAYVEFDGKVDPAFSRNISDATHPSSGIYCFTLPFAPLHAQATGQADGESNDIPSVTIAGTGSTLTGCPAGSNVQVEVWETELDEPTSEEFYLAVW